MNFFGAVFIAIVICSNLFRLSFFMDTKYDTSNKCKYLSNKYMLAWMSFEYLKCRTKSVTKTITPAAMPPIAPLLKPVDEELSDLVSFAAPKVAVYDMFATFATSTKSIDDCSVPSKPLPNNTNKVLLTRIAGNQPMKDNR